MANSCARIWNYEKHPIFRKILSPSATTAEYAY